jgi:hypothetical protein
MLEHTVVKIIITTFLMQDIYTYNPETNIGFRDKCRTCSVVTVHGACNAISCVKYFVPLH